jgi:hypothetical protein
VETAQFLPLDYMAALDGMKIAAADGTERRLVAGTNILLPENKEAAVRSNFTPFNASLLLLLATFVAMLCELRRRKTYWGVAVIFYSADSLSEAVGSFTEILTFLLQFITKISDFSKLILNFTTKRFRFFDKTSV